MTTAEQAGVLTEEDVRRAVRVALEVAVEEPDDRPETAAGRAYLHALAPGGWMAPTWPVALGGRDATKAETGLIRKVMAEQPQPDLYPFFVGLHMVGPTLLHYGTEEQQVRFLHPIPGGAEIWCQLFSEPDAGSDLANVATRAEARDGGWTLTGQKTWTSRGHYADWGICLARTDPSLPKYEGLTVFAVPMGLSGMEVRPLVQMNGDRHFNEVFLDHVAVPDADRIGEVGAGWAVAHRLLAHERSSIGTLGLGTRRSPAQRQLPGWLRELASLGFLDDPVGRNRAMALYVRSEVSRLTVARAAAAARAGRAPGAEGSGQKLRNAALYKERAYLIKDAHRARGMLDDHSGHDEAVTAPSMSIRGGTDEIQRNIVAEKILGLPPEPRLDRDVPWSRSRKGLT